MSVYAVYEIIYAVQNFIDATYHSIDATYYPIDATYGEKCAEGIGSFSSCGKDELLKDVWMSFGGNLAPPPSYLYPPYIRGD